MKYFLMHSRLDTVLSSLVVCTVLRSGAIVHSGNSAPGCSSDPTMRVGRNSYRLIVEVRFNWYCRTMSHSLYSFQTEWRRNFVIRVRSIRCFGTMIVIFHGLLLCPVRGVMSTYHSCGIFHSLSYAGATNDNNTCNSGYRCSLRDQDGMMNISDARCRKHCHQYCPIAHLSTSLRFPVRL